MAKDIKFGCKEEVKETNRLRRVISLMEEATGWMREKREER